MHLPIHSAHNLRFTDSPIDFLFNFSHSSYMVSFIVASVTSFPHQQDNRLSRRRLPIMLHLRLAFLGRPDMGIVDNYHSLFTFSSSSWIVLIWLVSLPLQSLRSFTGKTTDSSPSCCCGRYRSLTSKATASVVDGYQSCFAFGLHSWAVLTWAVSLLLQSLRSFTSKTTASV